jgi:hypothetical protein
VKEMTEEIRKVEGVATVGAEVGSSVVQIELTDPAVRPTVIARVREIVHSNGKKVLGEDPVAKP